MAASHDCPLVTIVTPSFNQGQYLEKTILSVLRQDYPGIEYIVVDSMSTDETPGILARYAGYISRIIRDKDRGQSHALNKGFAMSSGQVMAWLNSDDCYASPRVVSDAVAYLKENPGVDLVYGRRKYIDATGFFELDYPYREFCQTTLMMTDYIPQECCFWRREIFDRAGAYIDENFDFAMDYELWLRFLASGACFASVNSFFGLFRYYQEQKSRSQWTNKGLPEVERLHERYLGRKLEEQVFFGLFMDYYYGFERSRHPSSEQIRVNLSGLVGQLRQVAKGIAPIDGWVHHRDLPGRTDNRR